MSDNCSKIEIQSARSKILTFYPFRSAYHFSRETDLRNVVSQFPEGVVACSSSFVAGKEHVDSLLAHSAESWARYTFLAHNRSIDLLMRITCQRQISKAVDASGIRSSRDVALFGLANEVSQISFAETLMKSSGGSRDDSLLELDAKKIRFLKEFHSLPIWVETERIPQLLQEKSAILVFSK